jgi:hypothetical protein
MDYIDCSFLCSSPIFFLKTEYKMTSISAYFKQIPSDSQYFVSIAGTTLRLSVFTEDAAAGTTSYVSGAAQGSFSQSNVSLSTGVFDASGGAPFSIFRDMGVTILSSGRTFRAVQLLQLDATNNNGANAGSSGWTSATTTPGVWKPSNEGVVGTVSTNALVMSSFGVFYFETGARGLGLAQGLVRYG